MILEKRGDLHMLVTITNKFEMKVPEIIGDPLFANMNSSLLYMISNAGSKKCVGIFFSNQTHY
jgi:hypothetical protein